MLAIRAFAETTHPRGREAAADAKWRAQWDGLAARANGIGDGPYVVGLHRGMAWFEDGHSSVLPFHYLGGPPPAFAKGPFGKALPLKTRAFHDGLWVTEAGAEAKPLLGARIVRVNGVGDVELMRRHAAIWSGSDAWAHNWGGLTLDSLGMLQGQGLAPATAGPIRVEAVTPSGQAVSAMLTARAGAEKDLAKLDRKEAEREGWAKTYKGGNYAHPLPDRKALYVSIDEMGDIEARKFSRLTRDVFAALEAPGIERVVIDLRRNGGGDNFWGEPLRKGLERSRFNRPGGLYVMTSPATFSAAQNLANRLERETYAVFIGEPTGGSPNHYGDGKVFKGSVTGVTILCSTIPWFDSYPMDRRKWISPDLPSPALFGDWAAGRDPALELALGHRIEAAPDDLTEERTFFFRRDSQKAPWGPFWRT